MPLILQDNMAEESFPRPFAGIDEAGRGCLAGPVVAGAVILPEVFDLPGLNDSKKLTAKKRGALEPAVKAQAVAWGVGVVWPQEIDRTDILRATFKAMSIAARLLRTRPVHLAIDGNHAIAHHVLSANAPHIAHLPQTPVIGGDGKVAAISAASILAKTFRDRIMEKLEARYPGYGFAGHKGYGTPAHIAAIRTLGPSRMHRLTFAKVKPEPAKQESLCLPGI